MKLNCPIGPGSYVFISIEAGILYIMGRARKSLCFSHSIDSQGFDTKGQSTHQEILPFVHSFKVIRMIF